MVSRCCRQEGTWLPVCSRAPGLLVRLGPLGTNTKAGSSLQGSETGGKARLGGEGVPAAHGSLSPFRDAMQRQEAFAC